MDKCSTASCFIGSLTLAFNQLRWIDPLWSRLLLLKTKRVKDCETGKYKHCKSVFSVKRYINSLRTQHMSAFKEDANITGYRARSAAENQGGKKRQQNTISPPDPVLCFWNSLSAGYLVSPRQPFYRNSEAFDGENITAFRVPFF